MYVGQLGSGVEMNTLPRLKGAAHPHTGPSKTLTGIDTPPPGAPNTPRYNQHTTTHTHTPHTHTHALSHALSMVTEEIFCGYCDDNFESQQMRINTVQGAIFCVV